jgi:uncharacterized protein with HEPN domain
MRCCGTSPCSAKLPSQLSTELKKRNPDVPWARPTQLRNRIVHGYWSVDLDVLYATALDQLPAFLAQVKEVFESLPGE